MGVVYINHHIDTEGPLWENIQELFDRINLIFEIRLEPTRENLKLLQNGKIEIPEDKKKELLSVIDPHTIGFKHNWEMIEKMLLNIMNVDFRNELKDSFGGGWIYNWHVMDHVGFGFGYNSVYNSL